MTSRPAIQCTFCAHYHSPLDDPDRAEQDDPAQVCDAFPDGIPEPIWWGRADHREPYRGDHGVRWEPLDGAEFPGWALQESRA